MPLLAGCVALEPCTVAAFSWQDTDVAAAFGQTFAAESRPGLSSLTVHGSALDGWVDARVHAARMLNAEGEEYRAPWTILLQGRYFLEGENKPLLQAMVPLGTQNATVRAWLDDALAALGVDEATLDALAVPAADTSRGQAHSLVTSSLVLGLGEGPPISLADYVNNAPLLETRQGNNTWRWDVRVPVWRTDLGELEVQVNGAGLGQGHSMHAADATAEQINTTFAAAFATAGLPVPRDVDVTWKRTVCPG